MRRRFYSRRYFRDIGSWGDLGVGLDAFLPPLVGGGATMGLTLILRGLVPRWKKKDETTYEYDKEGNPVQNWAHQYAGLLGMGAGVLGSIVLGPFKGWGSTVSGVITSVLAGSTAQLYDAVIKKEEFAAPAPISTTSALRQMMARPAPFSQPYIFRGGSRLGQLQAAAPVQGDLPENVSAFPADYSNRVNLRAFGGSSW